MKSPRDLTGASLEPLLSVEELAALCGVPPKTVHRWLLAGTAPRSLRVGKYRRFRRSDVAAWWDSLADARRP